MKIISSFWPKKYINKLHHFTRATILFKVTNWLNITSQMIMVKLFPNIHANNNFQE